MASYRNVAKYLGYGGEGQPLGPPINPDRAGEHCPPTYRELMEYGLHLGDTLGGGKVQLSDVIK